MPEESRDLGIRASDAERETAVERLREAAAEGRLSLEELANRTETVYGAQLRADLERVVADLPAQTAVPQAPDRKARRIFLGIMGGDTLRGPMHLEGECTIVNVMGGVDLDLSQATIVGGELTVTIVSIMGGSTIRVPHGVRIDRSGFSVMGGDSVKSFDGPPPPPDAPVVRIRTFNLMGGNTIRPSAKR
ncbi:MAG TPA: DUF1707 domain-containing protein [Thermoleophilaceae bacterium]|nr:DUF1707 domain-containing protein [Thermoleophilaceae bacterium]